jgi:hypothetical protein
MATLDSRFICVSDLELYLVDNSSGLPLSGGILTFYSDVNRTVLKPVYQLTGTPGNYSYQPLNDPCTLSSSGTFQDALGNNIVPYYYPFEGTPAENTGIQELYYITCVNSGFVPQFTRQGWPQAAGTPPIPINDEEVDNYIPNGQFLSHNDWVSLTEPPFVQYAYGAQTVDSQAIAQGGWNFVYNDGTSATFNNSFSQIPSSGGWGINSFPKFLFNFVCTSTGGNPPQTRDLRIQWPDVNKFSSGNPPGTIPYTLFFDARSNDGNIYTFQLFKIYYFGTAGNGGAPSDPVEEFVANIVIGPTATLTSQNINDIIFSVNLGEIGANNDDYVALSLRGPASPFNVSFSDFLLTQGNEIFTSFPVQTNDQMLSRGVAGWMPTPDPMGFDMYLPLVLTPQGMTFDHSIVGQIIAKTEISTNTVNNELFMNGATYIASEYSAIGIPYQRLANYLLANAAAVSVTNGSTTSTLPAGYVPMYGTGPNFVTIFINATSGKFDLSMNTASGSNSVNNQTSGFTNVATDPLYVFTVPGVPTAGQFFSFTVATSGPLTYNVWFSVTGSGTAPPEPTGANIQVSLGTGDTITTTIQKIALAVNSYQFQVLDLRGYFLRGLDPSATIDPDAASRTLPGISDNTHAWTGANLGSKEVGAFASHVHPPAGGGTAYAYEGGSGDNVVQAGGAAATSPNTGAAGGTETRPINIAVNFFIKY